MLIGLLSVAVHYSVLYYGLMSGINQDYRNPKKFYILNFFCAYEIGDPDENRFHPIGIHKFFNNFTTHYIQI